MTDNADAANRTGKPKGQYTDEELADGSHTHAHAEDGAFTDSEIPEEDIARADRRDADSTDAEHTGTDTEHTGTDHAE